MSIKPKDITTIRRLGLWRSEHYFVTSENAIFDVVGKHGSTSRHYQRGRAGILAPYNGYPYRQGNLANDVNVLPQHIGKCFLWVNAKRVFFRSESAALKAMFDRTLDFADKYNWPLNEMFFDRWGWVEEAPGRNNPISGHTTHLHDAYNRARDWRR